MSTNFPASLDDGVTLPNPTGANNLNSPDHASEHANENDAIKALETKLGTGSSTASAGRLLRGTGSGATAYGQLVMSTDVAAFSSADLRGVISDKTGTGVAVFGTSPTIATPTLTSPTISGTVTGSGIIASTNVATGFVVQTVGTTFSSLATGTTTIPFDDTIPQNTEGDEYMTQSITPKSASNVLVIEVLALVSNSAAVNQLGALFQDSTANALAAGSVRNTAASETNMLVIRHVMAAGTTSATTFKFRSGGSGAGTTTFNGSAGARLFGAVTKSSIVISEVRG